MGEITTKKVYEWLEEVKDPEIPVLSLIDLGVITGVTVHGGGVLIEMTPTFVGCPALDMMQSEIRDVLSKNGAAKIDIVVSYKTPWTSDKISKKGKKALKDFGLSPPPARQLFSDLDVLERANCPRCGSSNTELKNTFGATLCRALYYCGDCKEAFEQFKPL